MKKIVGLTGLIDQKDRHRKVFFVTADDRNLVFFPSFFLKP
jgi:hypothetical protein